MPTFFAGQLRSFLRAEGNAVIADPQDDSVIFVYSAQNNGAALTVFDKPMGTHIDRHFLHGKRGDIRPPFSAQNFLRHCHSLLFSRDADVNPVFLRRSGVFRDCHEFFRIAGELLIDLPGSSLSHDFRQTDIEHAYILTLPV